MEALPNTEKPQLPPKISIDYVDGNKNAYKVFNQIAIPEVLSIFLLHKHFTRERQPTPMIAVGPENDTTFIVIGDTGSCGPH